MCAQYISQTRGSDKQYLSDKITFKALLNWFLLWDKSFIWVHRLLNTLIPEQYVPFWYIDKLDTDWCRFDLVLVLMLSSLEFTIKQSLSLITKSKSDSIFWNCNGNIFNFLKCSLRESLLLIPTMILIIPFAIWKWYCYSGNSPRILIHKSLWNENRNSIPSSVNPGTRMV